MIKNRISNLFTAFLKKWIDVKIGKLNSKEIFQQILLISTTLCIISTISNILLNLSTPLIFTTGFSSIIFGYLYYLVRFKNHYHLSLYIFISLLFLMLNILWFLNAGSYGPTLLIFQAFIPMFLFFTEIRRKLYIIFLFCVNISILFAVEYFYPETITQYATNEERILDLYFISFIFFMFEIPLLYFIQKQFITESLKAINSEKVKSAFLANMSHEIRTPMNAIIGFTELLKDPHTEEEIKDQYLDIIKDNGNVLLQILNNVMDASKIEAGIIEVNNKTVKIKPFFERIYATFLGQIPSNKQIFFTYEIPKNLTCSEFYTDELLMYQIISNLISNAIKFTSKGFVKFGIEAPNPCNPDWIKIYVSDSGTGISNEDKNEIFKRFNQGKVEFKDKKDGVGLGLAISSELAKKLNGSISLESSNSSGSTFSVTLNKINIPVGIAI
ncbi:hypothetical protein E9993_06540 [Labilibacter sediminis]|nr:hypothetical protein E9993_06540 [Labilibacter sediminis]